LFLEDYLDEVIGQYFNQDEDESSADEAKPLLHTALKESAVPKAKVAPVKKNRRIPALTATQKPPPRSARAESSDDDEEEEEGVEPPTSNRISPPARARIRPPASFFSMDFLEDPADEDDLLEWQQQEQDEENPPASTRPKVKTELEIELEYKHILYGGKRRKGAKKICLGKKKKKKTTNSIMNNAGVSTSSGRSIKQISVKNLPVPVAKKGKKMVGKKNSKMKPNPNKLAVDHTSHSTRR
jgi:hypothetical protein